MKNGGSHYVILLYWNFIVSLTGYSKIFYRTPLSLSLYYCCFTYFVFIEIGSKAKKCHLKCPKVTSMRLTLKYSVCTIISACTHLCDTTTFTHSLTRMLLFQLKIHNIWMEYFWNQKIFHLSIKEISTLKSYIKNF